MIPSAFLRGVFLSVCIGAAAHAQATRGQTTGSGLTLRAAVDSALRNNPDRRVAISLVDSAYAERRVARAFPNPTLSVIPNTPMQYAGTIPIDIGPQRIYRVRASDLGARAVEGDLGDNARQLTLSVRRAYYDVLLADARRTIVDGRRQVMRQIVSADSARVRAGDIPERAVVRSEVELVRTEADAARAGVDAQTARLVLQGLMGVTEPDTAVHLAQELHFRDVSVDADELARNALANRPDLQASRLREGQSAAVEHLTSASLVPIPQLTYVRQFGAPFDSGRYFALGLGLEIPVLNLYRGQHDRAAAGRVAAEAAHRRLESQVNREVRSAVAELQVQRALVLRYEAGVLTKVHQNVDASRYAYSHGATSLLDVLDALRAEQDVMTDYSTALHDYWVAVYSVRAATGSSEEVP
ncbi:MAG TPA: TolC family protein [Gemmatimonadaceae bacterium]